VTGASRHAAPLLQVAGGVVILGSAAIGLLEFLPAPGPWDEWVYRTRRARLADILGPAQWPSVERRSTPRAPVIPA
jgi:hypothetical protein